MRKASSTLAGLLAGALVCGLAGAAEKAEILYSRGLVSFHAGRYQEALALFDQAIAADPGDAYAYYYRGVTRGRLRDFEGAVLDLRRSLELNPELGEATLELGVALVESGRYEEAVPVLERARASPERDPPASLFLGLAFLRLGRPEEARANFERAAAGDPALALSGRYYQGVVAYQESRWQDAEEHFIAVVEADPDAELGQEAARFLEAVRARRPGHYQVFGSLALEYDSNLTLGPDQDPVEGTESQESDGRVAMLVGGTVVPWRSDTALVAVGYDLFQSLHFHDTDFNLQAHRPNVEFVARRGRLGYGMLSHYDYYRLEDAKFLQEVYAVPWLTWTSADFGRSELGFRARHRDFLDDDFRVRDGQNYAAGIRQVVELGTPERYALFGYRFDREDPSRSEAEAQRYGYDGQEVSGGLGWEFPLGVSGEAVYAYRHERYDQDSALFDPNGDRRRDDEHVITAVAYRDLTRILRLRCAFFGTINDSNQDEFQYRRYIGSIGLDVRF